MVLKKVTKKIFLSSKGFTLIEALVVMTIMGIIIGATIPSFRGYSRRLALREGAVNVRGALFEAQSLALSPRKIDATSYQVAFTRQAPQNLTFKIIELPSNTIIGKTISLTRGAYIKKLLIDTTDVPTALVDFRVAEPKVASNDFSGTTLTPAGDKLTITIGLEGASDEYAAVLNRITGQVFLEK